MAPVTPEWMKALETAVRTCASAGNRARRCARHCLAAAKAVIAMGEHAQPYKGQSELGTWRGGRLHRRPLAHLSAKDSLTGLPQSSPAPEPTQP